MRVIIGSISVDPESIIENFSIDTFSAAKKNNLRGLIVYDSEDNVLTVADCIDDGNSFYGCEQEAREYISSIYRSNEWGLQEVLEKVEYIDQPMIYIDN